MTSLLPARLGGTLSEVGQPPRIRHVPPYAASSGPEVRELAARAGLVLDPWEAVVLDDALGERPGGDWAAFEVGLVVPRQNGKGSIIEARELGGLFLLNEPLILHTAHEVKTAGEAFLRILGLITDSDEFSSRVKRINKSHGEEGIELRPSPTIVLGAGGRQIRRSVAPRLRFLARSRVAGRGFTGRVVIFDEAFELADASMSALLPTMSAQPNPQLWYTSTPPNQAKDHNARVLARLRRRAIDGTGGRLVYLEWSADADGMDPGQRAVLRRSRAAWAQANPALGIRITEEFIESELGALDPTDFDVERLGVGDWPSDLDDAWAVIGRDVWAERVDRESQASTQVAFALDVTPSRSHGAIAVAGRRADRLLHVEVTDHRPGTSWMVARAKELADKWEPCAVVVDKRSPAGSLIHDLQDAGVATVDMSGFELGQACGQFFDAAVDSGELPHLGQPMLDAAVAGAMKRTLGGDAWAWDRRKPTADICPLVAATNALWGFTTHGDFDDVGVYAM